MAMGILFWGTGPAALARPSAIVVDDSRDGVQCPGAFDAARGAPRD